MGACLYSLRATAHGFGSAYKSDVRPGATVNLMVRPGGWLAGRVIDPKGVPVRGALVRAEKEPQFWSSSSVETTDAAGRFEIPASTGNVFGRGLHVDFALASSPDRRRRRGRADLSIGLAVGAAVTGRLVDRRAAAGRPRGRPGIRGPPMGRASSSCCVPRWRRRPVPSSGAPGSCPGAFAPSRAGVRRGVRR